MLPFFSLRLAPVRSFSTTVVPGLLASSLLLATKTPKDATKKTTKAKKPNQSPEKAKLRTLKTQLKKEKLELSKLRTQFTAANKKLKALEQSRRAKAQEKEKLAKALADVKAISSFNVFIKENVTLSNKLEDVSKQWQHLAADERDKYRVKAEQINAKLKETFRPKPTRPPSSFANYIKQNFVSDGTFGNHIKGFSEQWNLLSPEEKAKYAPSEAAKEEFNRALEAWKAERIEQYEKGLTRKKFLETV